MEGVKKKQVNHAPDDKKIDPRTLGWFFVDLNGEYHYHISPTEGVYIFGYTSILDYIQLS